MAEETRNVGQTVVSIVIDVDELEEIKSLTNVATKATAIMAAARIGAKFLKKVNSVAEAALLNENAAESIDNTEKALTNV